MHSWSACHCTDSVMLRMTRINRPISVNKAKKQVTVEAGMLLRDLYKYLLENKLAVYSLPNVDTITVGGCIANCTHGTNINCGTSSSMVAAVEILVFESKGGDIASGQTRLVRLEKDDADPTKARWFEGVIASFGSLGVLYSVTFQCRAEYNVVSWVQLMPLSEHKAIPSVAEQYDSCLCTFGSSGSITLTVRGAARLCLAGPSGSCLAASLTRVHADPTTNLPSGQHAQHV